MVSPEACTDLVTSSGYSPINVTAAREPQYLGDFLTANPLYKPGFDGVQDVVVWEAFPGDRSNEISTQLDEQMILALRGSKSAADALNDAADSAKRLLS